MERLIGYGLIMEVESPSKTSAINDKVTYYFKVKEGFIIDKAGNIKRVESWRRS